ncbi:hypothetical protein GCM10023331_17210 [Algivirga pacifica]|uniref:Uncharacterized protein n=2 Tax=Algivirga pacifica TaxID=1162670 RepID=A0ABP9DAB4_9BACT
MAFLVQACSLEAVLPDVCENQEFTLERENYTAGQLPLNGYYYSENDTSTAVDVVYLYGNGVVYYYGEVTDAADIVRNGNWIPELPQNYQTNPIDWGLFQVNNEQLDIQTWYPGLCGAFVLELKGAVVKDSLFKITTYIEQGVPFPLEKEHYYYFRESNFKPDSINLFIN